MTSCNFCLNCITIKYVGFISVLIACLKIVICSNSHPCCANCTWLHYVVDPMKLKSILLPNTVSTKGQHLSLKQYNILVGHFGGAFTKLSWQGDLYLHVFTCMYIWCCPHSKNVTGIMSIQFQGVYGHTLIC